MKRGAAEIGLVIGLAAAALVVLAGFFLFRDSIFPLFGKIIVPILNAFVRYTSGAAV